MGVLRTRNHRYRLPARLNHQWINMPYLRPNYASICVHLFENANSPELSRTPGSAVEQLSTPRLCTNADIFFGKAKDSGR